jgi:hypothetical protein
MKAPLREFSTHIYEMMARLGIEPGARALPQLSLRYATALRRCEGCRSKPGLVKLCASNDQFCAYERRHLI